MLQLYIIMMCNIIHLCTHIVMYLHAYSNHINTRSTNREYYGLSECFKMLELIMIECSTVYMSKYTLCALIRDISVIGLVLYILFI
jgi:hypothetical protein